MNLKDLTSGLIGELRGSVSKLGLDNRKDISKLHLSTESMDSSSHSAAEAAAASLDETVESCINLVLGAESATVTPAQRSAARRIAALAIDPVVGMEAIRTAKSPAAGSSAVSVSAEDMGVIDAVGDAVLTTEAFDGQSTNNALYFSVAYNLASAKQDALGELFFPTLTIDPTQSGIAVSTQVTSLYQNVIRNNTGASSRAGFNKVTLAKAIYDNNLFGGDRNRVVPVNRPAAAANLLTALATVDNTSGSPINTAPLVIGKTIGLLEISQTDAQLAKGAMDTSDALDRTVNLRHVIVSLTANLVPAGAPAGTAAAPVTEYFRIPVHMFPGSNFTYTPSGHDKDLQLAFDSQDIVLDTAGAVTWNGTASAIMASLPAGFKIRVHMKLTGDGNTQYGDVSVYSTVAALVDVLDPAGNVLPAADPNFTAINTVFNSLTVNGYDLEAYTTNSNLRKEGRTVTIDNYEQLYSVPVRSGITVNVPVNSSGADDSALIAQIQTTGFRMSLEAVNTLVSFTDNLGLMTANGTNTNVPTNGVGRYHVNTFFNEQNLDLATIVDSESSATRVEDIRAAMVNRIRDIINVAYIQSTYNVVHDMMNGFGSKVGVIIGTSSRMKSYLCADGSDTIDIGGNFVVKVADSANAMIGDSLYITFSNHMSSKRNTELDPISFGVNLWAPTIATDVAKTVNGATVRSYQTTPRFLHVVNLPIMIRMNVTNVAGVLGKLAEYYHVV